MTQTMNVESVTSNGYQFHVSLRMPAEAALALGGKLTTLKNRIGSYVNVVIQPMQRPERSVSSRIRSVISRVLVVKNFA